MTGLALTQHHHAKCMLRHGRETTLTSSQCLNIPHAWLHAWSVRLQSSNSMRWPTGAGVHHGTSRHGMLDASQALQTGTPRTAKADACSPNRSNALRSANSRDLTNERNSSNDTCSPCSRPTDAVAAPSGTRSSASTNFPAYVAGRPLSRAKRSRSSTLIAFLPCPMASNVRRMQSLRPLEPATAPEPPAAQLREAAAQCRLTRTAAWRRTTNS
mmetsp:Transcript_41257/g.123183  ORF Transcript_41257/g.123183 Transcript_41257/m.123183 type:complete len:214 (+) Transcript_41257:2113-2754(+)